MHALMNAPTKACETCGRMFEKGEFISRRSWSKRRFCSRRCFGAASSAAQRRLPDRACRACGKAYRPRHFGARFCSTECAKYRHIEHRGAASGVWKGGRIIHESGYVMVRLYPEEPMFALTNKSGYAMEHRLVMSEILGRPMESHETVHHKNGKRDDNRPENLELRTGKHGRGATKHCPTCTCGG